MYITTQMNKANIEALTIPEIYMIPFNSSKNNDNYCLQHSLPRKRHVLTRNPTHSDGFPSSNLCKIKLCDYCYIKYQSNPICDNTSSSSHLFDCNSKSGYRSESSGRNRNYTISKLSKNSIV